MAGRKKIHSALTSLVAKKSLQTIMRKSQDKLNESQSSKLPKTYFAPTLYQIVPNGPNLVQKLFLTAPQ